MPTEANSINASTVGIVGNTGTSIVGTPVTQYNVIVGASTTSTLSNVAPSATSGIPLVSAGAAANPSFTTAVVAGGGTGNTTFTAYSVIAAGTTATGVFQNVSGVGTSGQVLTSNGAAALPTWQTQTGGTGISTINGDTGSITGSTVTIKAGVSTQNSGSSVTFVSSSATSNLNVTDASFNTIMGSGAGNATLSGTDNSCFGYQSGKALTSASNNALFGYQSGVAITTSPSNTAMGALSLSTLSTGSGGNCAIGYKALQFLTTGNSNTAVGSSAGINYTSSETGNILLANAGVVGESFAMRLGTVGTQTVCFISGVAGAAYKSGSPTPAFAYVDTSNAQVVGNLSTASATVTSNFGSLVVGTGLQNTANYGILVNVSIVVTVATSATITLGVGSTSTPTTSTVVTTFTVAAASTYSFSAIVPPKYYMLVNTTGTITIGSITTQACGM